MVSDTRRKWCRYHCCGFLRTLSRESAGLDAEPIQDFVNNGGLFIAAAGNQGSNNDLYPHFPASYSYDGVISVTSSNQDDELTETSNYGEVSVDLAAPGLAVDALVPGETGYEALGSLSGSSASAALVAGSAVLLKAKHPALSGRAIEAHLIATGDELAETGVTGNIQSGKRIHIGNALTGDQAPLEAPTVLSFALSEAPREVILNWEYRPPEGLLGFDVALFRPSDTEDNEPILLVGPMSMPQHAPLHSTPIRPAVLSTRHSAPAAQPVPSVAGPRAPRSSSPIQPHPLRLLT